MDEGPRDGGDADAETGPTNDLKKVATVAAARCVRSHGCPVVFSTGAVEIRKAAARGQAFVGRMHTRLRLAVYEPDIPQNVGAMVRLAAALGCPLELIEPFGFVFDHRKLHRAALGYHTRAEITRHPSWNRFQDAMRAADRRLVLLSTAGATDYRDLAYDAGDVLLVGSESRGVAPAVPAAVDARGVLPMEAGVRSLNVTTQRATIAGGTLRAGS
ncbi:tRNA (cytidine(34)-2'-O)-methyltransferase, partial [Thiohalocapsa sp.]|uniref:tRNA (cytidine(34)-2'-O)-methyltransferase n=1 Tax=Thiohalocapsa sp. TaxID=2497641 RepID=UPI0025F53BAF